MEQLHKYCFQSLGLEKNDNIILSPLTFVSGANSIALSGANPIFVDIKRKIKI